MIKQLIFLLQALGTLCAFASPLLSNFPANTFSSGEMVVVIGSQLTYDFQVPFTSTLPSTPVALALSMEDYHQVFDSSHKIFYHLLENTPSASSSTSAVFRVELGLYFLTSRAKVKYLACPSSILSDNFNLIVTQINPGNLSAAGAPSAMYF